MAKRKVLCTRRGKKARQYAAAAADGGTYIIYHDGARGQVVKVEFAIEGE